MFKLLWTVATLTAQGPQIGNVPETNTFKTEAACSDFGTTMTPRMADWMRGRLNAEWDHPVAVHFECELSGNPA